MQSDLFCSMTKESKSIWYSMWSWGLKRALELFFRRMDVIGAENIPKDKPVIFASNHTNALLDPLVITYFSGKQHYFMTRADVFKVKLLDMLFRSWRMLPMFRMKDGMETLSQNNAVMDFVTGKLVKGGSMIIFPEASHFWKRTIHPLKKGLVRMAYEVLEHDPNSELVIIPVGLFYNDMHRVNQDVLVKFGAPISVKDFPKADTMQKTYLNLTQYLKERMKEQILEVPFEDELYRKMEGFRVQLYNQLISLSLKEAYAVQKEWLDIVSTQIDKERLEQIQDFNELMNQPEIFTWFTPIQTKLAKPVAFTRLVYVLKWPFYLIAFVNFLPLFLITQKILSGIKDVTFFNSIKFGVGLIIMPFLTLIQGAVLALLIGNWNVFFLYLIAMPGWATLFAEFRGIRPLELYRSPEE